jgi:hypothetical protein
MPNKFQHQPLDLTDREIRVVDFTPPESRSSSIHLAMKHIKLRESPEYWALSYTWGAPFDTLLLEWDDPNATHTVYIDGQEFEVRWNLEAALRALSELGVHTIWIDGICIDQSNIPEKNQQVQMMGEIYTNARATFVWLGPESDDCSNAIDAIRTSIHSWPCRSEHLRSHLITTEDLTEYKAFAHNDLEGMALETIKAFARLLDRSWFRRIWIVQEVVLSREVVLLLGSRLIVRWNDLEMTVLLLRQHYCLFANVQDLQANKPDMQEALSTVLDSAIYFCRINSLRRALQQGDSLDLPLVVDCILPFESSDAKDKVYAVLGIISCPDIVRVDYNLSESEVFIATTRIWLEKTNDLRILSLCCHSSMPSLPSWAVDFTLDSGCSPLGSLRHLDSAHRLYHAGGHVPSSFRFENGTTLVVRGLPLGVLSFIGSTVARDRLWGEAEKQSLDVGELEEALYNLRGLQEAWLGDWMLHAEEMGASRDEIKKYEWTQEDLWKAFARTVCADVSMGDGSMTVRLDEDFDWTHQKDLRLLLVGTMRVILARRVFVATSLRHFCLAREDAQVGDVVFAAIGAETLFLLRPKDGGYYKFVCECYVHGFMDGKALRWMRMDDGTLTAFELKIK